MTQNKKMSDNDLKTLLSNTQPEKKYDIDLACQTLELFTNLKNKIQEDYAAIKNIKSKLSGIASVSAIIAELDEIEKILKTAEDKVESVSKKISV
jgi:hypothetical protein